MASEAVLLLGDLDAAIDRFGRAGMDPDESRRSITEVLNTTDRLNNALANPAWGRGPAGFPTRGLLCLRKQPISRVVIAKDVGWRWRTWGDLAGVPDLRKDPAGMESVKRQVAGKMVGQTFWATRSFLAKCLQEVDESESVSNIRSTL